MTDARTEPARGDETGDGDLLSRFLAGSEEAFERLVRRHGAMVLRTCRRMLGDGPDAEDAAQAVFLTLARKARALRGHTLPAGWLYRTAFNVARRSSDARRLRREREREAIMDAARRNREADAARDRAWREHLDDALAALPEKYRVAVVLHHLEGMSEAQTAGVLGCTTGAIAVRLGRARQMLHERLAQRGLVLGLAGVAALLSAEAEAAELTVAFASTTARAAALIVTGKVAASGASAHAVALMEGVLKAMLYAKLKAAAAVIAALAVAGGATGRLAYRALAEGAPTAPVASPPAAQAPPAEETGPGVAADVASLVRGDRVLAEFRRYPAVTGLPPRRDRPGTRPGDEARLAGQARMHAEVLAELKGPDLTVLKVVRSTEGQTVGLEYRSLVLVENRGAATLQALARHPAFAGGIVFRDGVYVEGLPYPAERLKERWAPNLTPGARPAAYAFRAWGSGDISRKKADMDLFRSVRGLQVDCSAPPAGSGGSLGWARLTPTGGLTLLEVFLRTGADFEFELPAILLGSEIAVVIVSSESSGRTISATVGQEIEIQLRNDREGAGWEAGAAEIQGDAVVRAEPGRRGNCDRFEATGTAPPPTTVGLYVYRYVCARPGRSSIRLVHLYPGGPVPVPRTATAFLGEFTVLVEVRPLAPLAGGPAAGPPTAGDRDVRERLRRPVTIQFADTPLPEVLAALSRAADLEIEIRGPAGGAPPVTLSGRDMPAETALNWVARLIRAEWRVEDQKVIFRLE